MTAVTDTEREAIDELRTTTRRFLAERATGEARRLLNAAESGDEAAYSPQLWATMAGQLGLQGLPFAEEDGGVGAGWGATVAVLEELGRAVLPSAYLASIVLAGNAIAQSGGDLARELLPQLAAGELTAALAVPQHDGQWDVAADGVRASVIDSGPVLSGEISFVLDGAGADVLVVCAATDGGPSLFVVEPGAAGLTRTPLRTLDPTRPQARLTFDLVPARPLGAPGTAADVLSTTYERALLALAADALGGADRCLQMALSYARERHAFGRPIGGFQAVKHKLADLVLEVELARAAVGEAAEAADADSAEASLLARIALAHTAQTYVLVATENIHLHGGIGFTWEHDAQLFFRRATSSHVLFGHPAVHLERVASHLLDPAS